MFQTLVFHATQTIHWSASAILLATIIFVFGLPIEILIRVWLPARRFSPALCLLAGQALFTLVSWFAFELGYRLGAATLSVVGIDCFLLIIPLAIDPGHFGQAIKATLGDAIERPAFAVVFAFFVVVGAFLFTIHLLPGDLSAVTMGNYDIAQYAALANFLIDAPTTHGNLVGVNYLPFVRTNVFGAFGLVGLASLILGGATIVITTAPLVAGAALIATSVAGIAREVFKLPWILAILLGAFLFASSTFVLTVGSYFLAQVLRSGFFLLAVAEVLRLTEQRDEETRRLPELMVATFLYGIIVLFIYPGLFFTDILILGGLGLGGYLLNDSDGEGVLRRAVVFSAGFCLVLGAIGVLAFGRIRDAFAYLSEMAVNSPAWPMKLLSPLSFAAVPLNWEVSFGGGAWIEFLLLGTIAVAALAILWRRRSTVGTGPILLVGVALASLLAYLVVWTAKGVSYQQWKFAGFYPMLLCFALPAFLFAVVDGRRAGSKGRVVVVFLAAGFAAVNLVGWISGVEMLLQKGRHFPAGLVAASKADTIAAVEGVVVDLSDFGERMLSTAIIRHKAVYLGGASYFGPGVDPVATVSPSTLLLRHEDACSANADLHLGGGLVLTRTELQPLPIDAPIVFGTHNSNCVRLTGFSDTEPWGRWTDGAVASIAANLPIAAAAYDHLSLVLTARAFIVTGHLDRQRVKVSINGAAASQIEITQGGDFTYRFDVPPRVDPSQELKIRFELPDAAAPSSFGDSTDSRVLGLGIKTLTLSSKR